MRSHVHASIRTGILVICIALTFPAAAAAGSVPGTEYKAELTGTLTFKSLQSGNNGSWTTTASFPLNGAFPGGTDTSDTGFWIPIGSIGATKTIYPVASPDFNPAAPDPNSSLSTAGSDPVNGPFNCGPFKVDNSLDPELGVITSPSGATSILVDWMGQALPEGGDTNQNGNSNAFPTSCRTNATFEMLTPLTGPDFGTGSPQFGLPWSAGYDTIRFSFGSISPTAPTQTLSGTSQSQTATATGQSDNLMSCANDSQNSCTESYPQISEQLTLTKVCSGTVKVSGGTLTGTCGGKSVPSGTTITKSKVSPSKHSASFSFRATGASGFQCALIVTPRQGHRPGKPRFTACRSPKSYAHLKPGKYEFEVRGVNSTGADKHPATKRFQIR